jgi:phage-related protein
MQNNYIPKTKYDFWLDGVSGSSLGLAVEIPPVPPMALQSYTVYRYGDDSLGYAPDNEFDAITITINARVIRRPDNYDNTELYAFLQGKKMLKISRLPDHYFRVRRVLGITPKLAAKGNDITYQIQFVCDPWKYISANNEFVLPNDGVIENEGTRFSKPIIRMNVTGTPATITTNGEVLTITTTGLITIDSDRMIVYKTVNGENTAITQYTQGKLPMFAVGTNLVQVSTNINSVTVVGNWRCY